MQKCNSNTCFIYRNLLKQQNIVYNQQVQALMWQCHGATSTVRSPDTLDSETSSQYQRITSFKLHTWKKMTTICKPARHVTIRREGNLWPEMYMYHVHPKVFDFIFVLDTNYYLGSFTRRLWLGLCCTVRRELQWSVYILFNRLINIMQDIFSWLSIRQKLLLLQPINITAWVR